MKRSTIIYTIGAFIFIFMFIFVYFIRDDNTDDSSSEDTTETVNSFDELVKDWHSDTQGTVVVPNLRHLDSEDDVYYIELTLQEIFVKNSEKTNVASYEFQTTDQLNIKNRALLNDKFLFFDLVLPECEETSDTPCDETPNDFDDYGGIWKFDLTRKSFERIIIFSSQ